MKPADRQVTPTLAAAVRRAAEVCDPEGANDGVAQLLARFEDRDEPITADAPSIEQQVAEAKGAVDPQDEDPAVVMMAAVTVYLAFRRDEVTDVPEDILRLAARAEFDGNPPPDVERWLEEQGINP